MEYANTSNTKIVGAKNHTHNTRSSTQTETSCPNNTGIKNHTPAMWWDTQTQTNYPNNTGAKNHTRETWRDIQTQISRTNNTGIKNHTCNTGWNTRIRATPKTWTLNITPIIRGQVRKLKQAAQITQVLKNTPCYAVGYTNTNKFPNRGC